jgi:hypothetical protein
MFGKKDPVDGLRSDLGRARDRRDALACEVTTLTAEIAVLESRISAENDRRERERAVDEIEAVRKQIELQYLALVPAITGMRDASQAAAAIVPEAREIDDILMVITAEVGNTIDRLLGDLDGRIEVLRAGLAAPELLPPHNGPPALPQNNDRAFQLPEWLPRNKPTKVSIEDQCSTAAA